MHCGYSANMCVSRDIIPFFAPHLTINETIYIRDSHTHISYEHKATHNPKLLCGGSTIYDLPGASTCIVHMSYDCQKHVFNIFGECVSRSGTGMYVELGGTAAYTKT